MSRGKDGPFVLDMAGFLIVGAAMGTTTSIG